MRLEKPSTSTTATSSSAESTSSLSELLKLKESLIGSLSDKLSLLQSDLAALQLEVHLNESLGDELLELLRSKAKINECHRFQRIVKDFERVTILLITLIDRLHNTTLKLRQSNVDNEDERRRLEAKELRLTTQLEEARGLETSIEHRLSTIKEGFKTNLTSHQMADLEHYVNTKIRLIGEQREVEESLKVGQQHVDALKAMSHQSKPANEKE